MILLKKRRASQGGYWGEFQLGQIHTIRSFTCIVCTGVVTWIPNLLKVVPAGIFFEAPGFQRFLFGCRSKLVTLGHMQTCSWKEFGLLEPYPYQQNPKSVAVFQISPMLTSLINHIPMIEI